MIRTGRDFCSFLGPDEEWAYKISIELGQIPYQEIPPLLGLADTLVQPGADNSFNEYRLPGKLPEFFAMGRPVVLPQTNVGRFVEDGKEGVVLDKVDALGIVETVLKLRGDKGQAERLAAGAVAFAREHFDWKKNANALAAFYEMTAYSRNKGNAGAPA